MKKLIFIYVALHVIVLALLGLIQKVDVSKADMLYYVALLIATFLGVTHVILMNKYRFPQASRPFGFRFRVTLFILLISVITAFFLYRLVMLDVMFLTFIIPFMIPYIVWQCFLIFSSSQSKVNQ